MHIEKAMVIAKDQNNRKVSTAFSYCFLPSQQYFTNCKHHDHMNVDQYMQAPYRNIMYLTLQYIVIIIKLDDPCLRFVSE